MLTDIHINFYGELHGMTGGLALNEAYLTTAKRVGITHAVGIVLGSWNLYSGHYMPSLDDMRYGNRVLFDLVRKSKGFLSGYAFINPVFEGSAIEELDYCVKECGMVGIKLGASVRCTSPLLDPVVRRGIDYDIPILHHLLQRRKGEYPNVAISDAADLAKLARRHPQARFIHAHIGGGGDWQFGIRATADLPNVWYDLSGSGTDAGMLEFALRLVGEDRLLFATDLTQDTGMSVMDTLKRLGADTEKIGYLNAQKVFAGRIG